MFIKLPFTTNRVFTLALVCFAFTFSANNIFGQACADEISGFCSPTNLSITADFDVENTLGTCPANITVSDGINSITLPRLTAICNTNEESYFKMLDQNDPADTYNCGAANAAVDLGNMVCNYDVSAGFNGMSALPVELAMFKAYTNTASVLLKWESIMEINNEYFTVERSTDGRNFESIGDIDGAGTSGERNRYVLADKYPAEGTNYYRLKQTDFDGKSEYFPVVAVEFSQTGAISVYPNPVRESLNMTVTGAKDDAAEVSIFSLSSGQIVYSAQTYLNGNKAEIDVQNLPKGMYNVVLTTGRKAFNTKFVKQ